MATGVPRIVLEITAASVLLFPPVVRRVRNLRVCVRCLAMITITEEFILPGKNRKRMESMNVNGAKRTRAPKVKIYTVDTRKPDAGQKLALYTPANGFTEMVSARRSTRSAPVFRYFYFSHNPTVGAPGASGAPVASANNNYGSSANNNSLNDIIGKMAAVGVNSKDEFDELADMLESKAVFGGKSRKAKRANRKNRKDRKITRKN